VEEYKDVVNSKEISTFPVNSPSRWNVLLDAAIIGDNVFYPTTTVNGAPINKAVALLDSGTSYSCVLLQLSGCRRCSAKPTDMYLQNLQKRCMAPCLAPISIQD